MKALQLGINYGMGVPSLARGLDRHPIVASNFIERHRRTYPRFWDWRDNEVQVAMLERRIETVFGWPLHLTTSPNQRTLYNFPMQGNGAEMVRLAACRLCDAGIVPCMLIHDGILLEARNDEQVEHAIEIMRKAGQDVCNGLEIGVDVDQRLDTRCALSRQAPARQTDVGDDHGCARSRPGHTEEGVGVSEYVIRGGRRIEVETLESKTPAKPKRTRQDQFVRVPLIWVDRLRGGRCRGSYRLALHLLFHHWKSDGKPIKLSKETLAVPWRLHVDRSTKISCSRSLPTSKSMGRPRLKRCARRSLRPT
jgi:hypothetical protein